MILVARLLNTQEPSTNATQDYSPATNPTFLKAIFSFSFHSFTLKVILETTLWCFIIEMHYNKVSDISLSLLLSAELSCR